ncbi:MAG: riboflavin synthase [Gemmatimonadetes bacterium]|nr:riboflavin synthase [Gemmatimonadota bacterium]
MFTGIIEALGRVRDVESFGSGLRLSVAAEPLAPRLAPGESIAVDGVCQTIVAVDATGFLIEAVATTLSRTTLGSLERGRPVNLERPLALGDRLGGHLLQGHVDGVGELLRLERQQELVLAEVRIPAQVSDVTVLHGSIAINGVSLTVSALPAPDVAQIALVPYTWEHTAFPHLMPGDAVNVEGDLLGKFVVHYLARRGTAGV